MYYICMPACLCIATSHALLASEFRAERGLATNAQEAGRWLLCVVRLPLKPNPAKALKNYDSSPQPVGLIARGEDMATRFARLDPRQRLALEAS